MDVQSNVVVKAIIADPTPRGPKAANDGPKHRGRKVAQWNAGPKAANDAKANDDPKAAPKVAQWNAVPTPRGPKAASDAKANDAKANDDRKRRGRPNADPDNRRKRNRRGWPRRFRVTVVRFTSSANSLSVSGTVTSLRPSP